MLFVHLALAPVVFSRATVEAFEDAKVALLLVTAIFLAALAFHRLVATDSVAYSALVAGARGLGRDPLALGLLLLLVSGAASTVASISPRTSVLGAPESDAGLLTVASYIVLFFATRWLAATPADRCRLLLAPAVGAASVSAYATVQLAGADPLPWARLAYGQEYVRPFSTMGHPNLLAGYLVAALPIVAYFARRAWIAGERAAAALFGAIVMVAVVAIVASVSRGAWLALAVVLVVLILGARRAGERRSGRIALLLFLVAGGALALAAITGPGRAVMANVGERARHLAEASSRLHIWRASLSIFADHPLLGSGLDTFQLAFEAKRTPAYWRIEWNGTPAKAHDEALHVLATQGLLGAAAMALVAVGLVVACRRAARQVAGEEAMLLAASVASLAGFVTQALFSFTVAGTGTLFVSLAAVVSAMGRAPTGAAARAEGGGGWLIWAIVVADVAIVAVFAHNTSGVPWSGRHAVLAAVVALALAGGSWAAIVAAPSLPAGGPRVGVDRRAGLGWGRWAAAVGVWAAAFLLGDLAIYRPLVANQVCREGNLLLSRSPREAVARFERAVALDPTREVYWVRLGSASEAVAERTADAGERVRALERALDAFREAVRRVPVSAYGHANLGRVLGRLAREGRAKPAEAFAAFDCALALDPNNAYFYADAAAVALALGDLGPATRYASGGAERYPDFGPTRWQLGHIALVEGRFAEAVGALRAALDAQWPDPVPGRAIAASDFAAALLEMGRFNAAAGP